MSQNDDFLSFEKALRELKLRSEELKKLVSEGEIRAFKDGDSMKFRREDIAALGAKAKGEDELAFADSLEDDTGMVTEQLTEEDTLLAEEDVPAAMPATRVKAAAPKVVAAEPAKKEPGWVMVFSVIGSLVLIWGFLVSFAVAKEANPAGSPMTSMFAAEKKAK